jgi:hypothetical protein
MEEETKSTASAETAEATVSRKARSAQTARALIHRAKRASRRRDRRVHALAPAQLRHRHPTAETTMGNSNDMNAVLGASGRVFGDRVF